MEGNPAADPGFNPDAVVRLPVQYWTFTMSNSKELQPRPRDVIVAHALAVRIQVVVWVGVCRSCFPLAVWRRAGTRRRFI